MCRNIWCDIFFVYGVYGVGSKQDLGYLIHAHPLQASMPGTQSTGTVVGFGLKYWMDGGEEGEAKLTSLTLRNSRGALICAPCLNKREKTRTRWAMLSANQHRPSRPYLLPLLAFSLWALFPAPIKFAHCVGRFFRHHHFWWNKYSWTVIIVFFKDT